MKINIRKAKRQAIIFAVALIALFVFLFANGYFEKPVVFNQSELSVKPNESIKPVYITDKAFPDTNEFVKVAENSRYILEYSKKLGNILVTDKISNYKWSNAFDENQYEGKKNTKIRRDISTLFTVGYTDYAGQDFVITSNNSDLTKEEVLLKNGLALNYKAEDLGISFTIEIWMDEGNSLYFRVPRDKIKDNSSDFMKGITYFDIMPMFGAASSKEEGYFIYPDGSGSIYNFIKQSNNFNSSLVKYVYGDPLKNQTELAEDAAAGEKQILMPYFGSVKKSDGFIGYIVEGDYAAKINLIPYGVILKLNRIYPTFEYRKYYTLKGPDDKIIYEIGKVPAIKTDMTVRYSFEDKEKGNYSGLSQNLRNWLLENKRLFESTKQPLKTELEFIMSVPERGMLKDNMIVTTSLSQAENIIKDIDDSKDNIEITLTGWQKGGFGKYPSHFPVNKGIGSKGDLIKFTKEYKNVYLNENYYLATGGASGFSAQTDVVLNQNGIPVSDEAGSMFFLNPLKQLQKFIRSQIDEIAKIKPKGILFDGIGTVLNEDYNKKLQIDRNVSMLISQSFLKETEDNNMKAASIGGNAYVLPFADKLYNIPDRDSKYSQMTRYIPFYQLVINGSYAYTGDTPINLASEYLTAKLRCIESGSRPYFVITSVDSSILKDSYVKDLFSTKYDDWKQVIKGVKIEFEDKLSFIYETRMIAHATLENGLVELKYENGRKIYINYSDTSIKTAEFTVKADDYLIN